MINYPDIINQIDSSDCCVAIDIGNVLVRWHAEVFIKKMVEEVCVRHEDPDRYVPDPMEWLEKVQPMQDLGISNIKHMLDLDFGSSVSDGILLDIESTWIKTISFVPAMTAKVLEWLQYRKVALLSNMGHQHLDYLRNSLPAIFDNKNLIQHISCEVGVRKPSKLFFQSFLLENPQFKDCPYLDDLQENVTAADRAGLNGFMYHVDWIKGE